ncbi:MAG: hypothetical protein AAGA26_02930 [Pseudomonadota bacterium]
MDNLGYLREHEGRFEFHFAEFGLVVRGAHPEWVLEAAAEVIAETAKVQADGHLEELSALVEFGEVSELEVDSAKFDHKARFEIMPQCLVTMGSLDYKWTSATGRVTNDSGEAEHSLERIYDMSLTRNDTFLQNEPGVVMSGE